MSLSARRCRRQVPVANSSLPIFLLSHFRNVVFVFIVTFIRVCASHAGGVCPSPSIRRRHFRKRELPRAHTHRYTRICARSRSESAERGPGSAVTWPVLRLRPSHSRYFRRRSRRQDVPQFFYLSGEMSRRNFSLATTVFPFHCARSHPHYFIPFFSSSPVRLYCCFKIFLVYYFLCCFCFFYSFFFIFTFATPSVLEATLFSRLRGSSLPEADRPGQGPSRIIRRRIFFRN